MICPTCRNSMIVVERERIELDYCTNCSGVWFDSGELELMLERTGIESSKLHLANILALPEYKTSEKRRKCPICNRKMKKATIGQKSEVLVDVCPHGNGLWFDGDEIDQLITQRSEKPDAESDSQKHILTFLEDTFKAKNRPNLK